MNVSLSPELERFVKKCVDNGYYTSASEVVRAALRELRPIEEARHFQRVDRLRALVQKALNDQIYYQKLGTQKIGAQKLEFQESESQETPEKP